MSNYDEASRKEETKQLAAKSQHSFLSQEERQNLQRMMAHPEDLPKEFKSWLVDYLQVFPPQTPLSQVIGATGTIQAQIDTTVGAHTADPTDAHDASAISIADAANDFTAINVEDALAELQSDAEAVLASTADHSARHENGGADEISIAGLDGTPVELTNHLTDTVDAHDASAISVDSTTLVGTGVDAQAVFEELDNAIADHLADAVDAHDASAISFSPHGSIAATDVQAAIQEVRDEAAGGGGTAVDDENLILHTGVLSLG